MKKLSIYEVYVLMQNQAQCDRMEKLCVDNGLPVWDGEIAFKLSRKKVFEYDSGANEFYCCSSPEQKTQITEQEFIELLKNKEK